MRIPTSALLPRARGSVPSLVPYRLLSTTTSRRGPADPSPPSGTRLSSPPATPSPTRPIEPLPPSSIPLLTTLPALRALRYKARAEGKSVGFVPTMGALHEGHISLVRRSLEENDLTLLSIYVNPTQFAPHEDFASYPSSLSGDLRLIESISLPSPTLNSPASASAASSTASSAAGTTAPRSVNAVFLPPTSLMYPSGVSQSLSAQRGTFLEVAGYSHQMEGRTRPTFFRGVATVVTKLFNAVQPDRAYFGQKDIQQALLLRRLCQDLLLDHPSAEELHIVPTARAPDGLALSSRNRYLTPSERAVAPTLHLALQAARSAWLSSLGRPTSLTRAEQVIALAGAQAAGQGVELKLDYVEMNSPETFEVVDWDTKPGDGRAVILSGAMWVGRTRLIDNLILGDEAGKIIR